MAKIRERAKRIQNRRACPPDLAAEAPKWRDHLIELPIHQGLSIEDVDRVADAVLSLL